MRRSIRSFPMLALLAAPVFVAAAQQPMPMPSPILPIPTAMGIPSAAPRAIPAATAVAPVGTPTSLASTAPTLSPTAINQLEGIVPSMVPDGKLGSRLHVRTLKNGLRVVVIEDHTAPVVQTGMWYKFGALDEVPGRTGLAHGLEHMMFRGTPSISEGGLDDISARLGAEENANTANDYTHFYFVLPASKLDLALHIEADRMNNLLLSEADWKLEKGAVLSEYDGDLGQPTVKLVDDVCKAATPVPLCGLGALGKRSDIVASTSADLRYYYAKYYHPNNATLVVAGDVRPEQVFTDAQKRFGGLRMVPVPSRPHSAPRLSHGRALTDHGDYPYTLVDLAYGFPGDLDAHAGPAAIFDGVLGNERSPYYANLVLSGIALGYETSSNSNLHGGLEHVLISVAPGHKASEAIDAFESTTRQIIRDGIAPDLIAAAKRAAAVNAVYANDSIAGLGDRTGYALGIEGRRDPSEDDLLIKQATDADVAKFVATDFAKPLVIGTLIPEHPKPGSTGSGTSGVADNFSNRVPTGPLHEASWVRDGLASGSAMHSRVNPTRYVLSNGIKLYVQPIHENPTVYVSGSIEGSPRFESANSYGVRNLVSSLMGYGSEHFDFEAQRRLADELGASLDLGTGFGSHGLARDLPTVLHALADGIEHPTFPAKYVSLERSQMLSEIGVRDKNPDYVANKAFRNLLFPAGDPELLEPTLSSITKISVDQLRSYESRYIRPDLTVITITGDISPQQARADVERAFGSWKASGPKPNISLPQLPVPKPAQRHITATRKLVSVEIGMPAPDRKSPDFYSYNLLNTILGGGGSFDTRLMHEIREQRGLVYSVSSGYQAGKYRGVMIVKLSADPKNVARATALVKDQLRKLMTTPPTQAELDRARLRLIASTLVSEEATSVISERVDTIAEFDLPTNYYVNLSSHYTGITPAAITATAKRYFRPDNLVIVEKGP